ncbi:MAG: 23S rRNA (uracil(1939)-C(5))-methyltransferase RlmD [Raoultibacter sp.]
MASEETITITALTYGGAGIGKTQAGKAVFVPDTAPGDVVRCAIEQEKKSFCNARLLEVVQASPQRIEPPCPFVAQCGGCCWQHISYDAQLAAKRANVVAALTHGAHFSSERAEGLVDACVPSKRQTGYRNKLELNAAFDKQGRFNLGFHKEGSHTLATPATCLLAHNATASAPKALQGALRYVQGTNDLGIFRVGVRHSLRTGDLEVALWTRPGQFPRNVVANTVKSAIKASSVVRVLADPGKSRKIKGVEVLAGKGMWHEKLNDVDFMISAPSFFQVNTAQAEALVAAVSTGLQLDENCVVADLYAGAGTFSLALAGVVDTVFAVESAASSVRDLRRNADANGVYVEVIGGDAARELPQLGALDALVVDPPRAGLAEGVAQSIAAAAPTRIAYVSCDPATWARDVVRLEECGYKLVQVTPFDLFPQTYHSELVSIFTQQEKEG